MTEFKIPETILTICETLRNSGFQAYLVGGFVRDSLLGIENSDYDLVTDAKPEEIETLFNKTLPTGKRFGTITVFLGEQEVEVTTMRQDGNYSDNRRPDQVIFTNELKLDLARRDFTINAIAYDPIREKLHDPLKGTLDLKRKILRTVGEPHVRFSEDPLRMLRLVRFKAVLNFKVHRKTKQGFEPHLIKKVSAERIQTELNKMLVAKNCLPALELFYLSGLMHEILPELAKTKNISAGKSHPHDLLGHSLASCHFTSPDLALRWAALLHDLGKTVTLKREHAEISEKMAGEILTRLKMPKALTKEVQVLIANHMFELHPYSSDQAFRRFLAKFGEDISFKLIKLRQGDLGGMNLDPRYIIEFGNQLEQRLINILEEKNAMTIKDLAIDGHGLMTYFDLKPSPVIGELLTSLLDDVFREPSLNTRANLLELASQHLKSLQ